MPTEEDIRSALSAYGAAVEPPEDPGRLLGDGRGPGGRRLWLVAAAAAVTAVAIMVPVVVLTRTNTDPATPTASYKLAIDQEFRFDPPAGWKEVGVSIQLDRQDLIAVGPDGTQCEVSVHRRGGFDARRIPPNSAPLRVKGRPGYFARVMNPADLEQLRPDGTPSVGDHPDLAQWAVVWQHAEDAWAVALCPYGGASQSLPVAETRRREHLIAEGLIFGRGARLVPFTVGYFPPGHQPERAWVQAPDAPSGILETYWFDLAEPAGRGSINVGIRTGAGLFERSPGSEDIVVGGRKGWVDVYSGTMIVAGEGYQLVLRHNSASSDNLRARLLGIAASIEIAADPANRSTWFDGRDAFPR